MRNFWPSMEMVVFRAGAAEAIIARKNTATTEISRDLELLIENRFWLFNIGQGFIFSGGGGRRLRRAGGEDFQGALAGGSGFFNLGLNRGVAGGVVGPERQQ